MITPANILSHEIIGLRAEIEQEVSKIDENLSGKIVFETKNMILIRTGSSLKNIPKRAALRIRLILPSGSSCFLVGSALIGRPEDRISRVTVTQNG